VTRVPTPATEPTGQAGTETDPEDSGRTAIHNRRGTVPADMDVALGGTFDPVHDGHRALFERAFGLGDVTVGLTSDDLASRTRAEDRPVRSYVVRRTELVTELERFAGNSDREFTVRRLDSPTGIATEPEFDVLVVSPETETGGKRINELRREQGRDPLELSVVDHVYADDGELLSSTRIVRGEVDEHGTLTPERDGRMADVD